MCTYYLLTTKCYDNRLHNNITKYTTTAHPSRRCSCGSSLPSSFGSSLILVPFQHCSWWYKTTVNVWIFMWSLWLVVDECNWPPSPNTHTHAYKIRAAVQYCPQTAFKQWQKYEYSQRMHIPLSPNINVRSQAQATEFLEIVFILHENAVLIRTEVFWVVTSHSSANTYWQEGGHDIPEKGYRKKSSSSPRD